MKVNSVVGSLENGSEQ